MIVSSILLFPINIFFFRYSHIDFPAKIGFAISNILAESVNSSINYDFVTTWGYGDMRYPEKLNGLIGNLVRNEIDVGGNRDTKN